MFFRLIIFFFKVLKAVTLGQAESLMFKEWKKSVSLQCDGDAYR